EPKGFVPYPPMTEPFVLGYSPMGIHFYRPAEALYLPYAALQAMRMEGESLTLIFAADEVQIEGCGLHTFYAQIVEQKVKRVLEQGERFADADGAAVFVRRILFRTRLSIEGGAGP